MSQDEKIKELPEFSLPTQTGEVFSSAAFTENFLVIYFYPKDDTPGCTIEAVDFSKLAPDFEKLGAKVVGISKDSVNSHQSFCQKHDLAITLCSDTDGTVCKVFDVLGEKKMFGKSYEGILRSTFVYKGKKLVYSDRNVSATGHGAQVLALLREL